MTLSRSFLLVIGAIALIASSCIVTVIPLQDGNVLLDGELIEGWAERDGGVDSVKLWIKDTQTNQYWNPAVGGWQPAWVEFDATLDDPGAVRTSWTFSWNPAGTGGSDDYRLRGVSYDDGVASDVFTRFFSVLNPASVVYFDDFDNTTLDTSHWKVVTGNYGANDSPGQDDGYRDQCYTTSPTNVRVEDGALILEAHREPSPPSIPECAQDTINFTSGMVVSNDLALPANTGTRGNLAFNQGRFEMRARWDDTDGMWPAFWLRPAAPANPWPQSGEIDIMEYPGPLPNPGTTPSALHAGVFAPDGTNDNGEIVVDPGAVETWHTYRLDWDDTTMRFYVDATMIHEAPIPAGPYGEDFFVTLNLQVDGWAGPPAPGTDTSTFEIDWVRISQLG